MNEKDWKNFNNGYKAGAETMRAELLQLCEDFSDLQNRPCMGDVLAQVNALFDLVISEIPRSLEEEKAQASVSALPPVNLSFLMPPVKVCTESTNNKEKNDE